MAEKQRANNWMLIHLKKSKDHTRRICQSFQHRSEAVNRILQSAAYHSMLNINQFERVENLQKNSLKMIYGCHHNYDALLGKSVLEKLEERRGKRVMKLTENAFQSECFKAWFPQA